MSSYIIVEAGVNHNGSLEMAKELVLVAKNAGADAIKFQTFKTENLVTKSAIQAAYQVDNLGKVTTQYEMLKNLELTFEQFIVLKKYCEEQKIEFLSTPFDYVSVDFLVDTLQMDRVKISSGELTNAPFIFYIAKKKKPIILSTGMATIEEIHKALSFIAYGLAENVDITIEDVNSFYHTKKAKNLLQKYVTILHCTTEYPAPYESVNLNVIQQLKEEFCLNVGLSDHSQGVSVPTAAVALGAVLIEKHFTLDKSLEGPDHVASLDPIELKEMVQQIRQVEISLGTGIKKPTNVEIQNRIPARKSLVAGMDIKKGDEFTTANLTIKRPGNGIAPENYWTYLGKKAVKNYAEDDLIDE